MPNAENAILDPFSAMAPTEAIMVAVCGLVVVFLMLAILALVIRINSKLVSLLEGRKEEPAPAPVAKHAPAAPAPAPAPAPAAEPAPAPAAAPVSVGAGETPVNSPMPGSIFKVECTVGQSVKAGDVLIVLEAMKMEIEVSAPVDGTVKAIAVSTGATVNTDDLLVTLG